jgi:hypothetical protein
MGAEELRYRAVTQLRTTAGRVRSAVAPPRWERRALAARLAVGRDARSGALKDAVRALRHDDPYAAHRALAAHFTARPSRFPLDTPHLEVLAGRIARRFPAAVADASRRADAMIAGRYDILGYRDVRFGHPPAWDRDPVHDRAAHPGFWSVVPYLSPDSGDHKIIWEINRHQHWLAFGRAHHLAGGQRYYAAFVLQLEDWLSRNPPLQGTNWASMLELAFRSLSWVWALHFFAGEAAKEEAGGAPWMVDLLLGLDRQLLHISHNLSTYFSPNTHLSGEALALYVCGSVLPELAASGDRLRRGRRILLEQIDRQVAADGGHAELSSHYQRYSTDFYLLATQVARLTADPAAEAFERAALRQSTYLRTITDDNGGLPLIGDDDGGQLFPICGRLPEDCQDTLAAASTILATPALAVGDVPEEVFWLCGRQTLESMSRSRSAWPSTALPESGYVVSRTADGDHLIFDVGRHGYLNAGHAHADALSVVLTVSGRRLLVDPGTATYTMDAAVRDRFRSTAMHNTVVLDGRAQSEPRGPFHWRTVAHAQRLAWSSTARFDYAEGMHDGYQPAIHARGVLAVHGVGWVIVDHLLGPGGMAGTADAHWHVHPAWGVAATNGGVTLRHTDGAAYALGSSSAIEILSPEDAQGLDDYAPEYGRIERAVCLRGRTHGTFPRSVATVIAPTGATQEAVTVTTEPVTHGAGESWHSAAFRLRWPGGEAVVLAAIERIPGSSSGRAPGQMWGSGDARTDGRFALVNIDTPGGAPIVIGGTVVETGGLIRA